MPFIETEFPGLMIFEPVTHTDNRGYFFESYNQNTFAAAGVHYQFVQDNQARSVYGVVRGLHYQQPPHAQTKLVRVLDGRILDVVVDLRRYSPTEGRVFTIELSAENRKQLLIPQGFAHGYSVLSATAEVLYKCDAFYNPTAEAGILPTDPALGINWGIPAEDLIIAAKDMGMPAMASLNSPFVFQANH